MLQIQHLTQYNASNQYTNSGSIIPSGICNTVTELVSPKVQMCFLVIQHVTCNQLSPIFVDTDPVIGIIIISRHLHQPGHHSSVGTTHTLYSEDPQFKFLHEDCLHWLRLFMDLFASCKQMPGKHLITA